MSDKREEARAVQLDREAAFLTALAEHGVPSDVQGLLVHGDERGTVAPGALRKAIAAAFAPPRPTAAEQGEGVRERVARIICAFDNDGVSSAAVGQNDAFFAHWLEANPEYYEAADAILAALATQPNEQEAGELREALEDAQRDLGHILDGIPLRSGRNLRQLVAASRDRVKAALASTPPASVQGERNRLLELEEAARDYAGRYMQDEAADECGEVCSEDQHLAAKRLCDAIADIDAASPPLLQDRGEG